MVLVEAFDCSSTRPLEPLPAELGVLSTIDASLAFGKNSSEQPCQPSPHSIKILQVQFDFII